MKLKILLICLLFPLIALGEEDILPIAPGSMGEFKGKEIKVFAPNPRLVVSTQTQSKKTLSKSSLSKRRVGRQSHVKRHLKTSATKRKQKISKRRVVRVKRTVSGRGESRSIKPEDKKNRILKRSRPSSTKSQNLRRVERKQKVKRKVSNKGRRSMGRSPASVAERKSRSRNRM